MGINYKGVSTDASKLIGLLDGDRLPDVSEAKKGGVATGTTNNESASLTHGNTGNETSALTHANGAVDAHSAHSSENNIPTYYALAFIMKS
jgi:hypothetical protein